MVSAVRTGIFSSVSAYVINCLMISCSFVPFISNERSNPRSLQFKDIIRKPPFVNPSFSHEVIKTGEAPVPCDAVLQTREIRITVRILKRKN